MPEVKSTREMKTIGSKPGDAIALVNARLIDPATGRDELGGLTGEIKESGNLRRRQTFNSKKMAVRKVKAGWPRPTARSSIKMNGESFKSASIFELVLASE